MFKVTYRYHDLSKINLQELCSNRHSNIVFYLEAYVNQMKETRNIKENDIFDVEHLKKLCLNPNGKFYLNTLLGKVHKVKNNHIAKLLFSDPDCIDIVENNLDRFTFCYYNILHLFNNPRAQRIIDTIIYLQKKCGLPKSMMYRVPIPNSKNFKMIENKRVFAFLENMLSKHKEWRSGYCYSHNKTVIDWFDIISNVPVTSDISSPFMEIIDNCDIATIMSALNSDTEMLYHFFKNPNFIHLIEGNLYLLNKRNFDKDTANPIIAGLCANPNAIHIIQNLNLRTLVSAEQRYQIQNLCQNPNPEALSLIEKNLELIKENSLAKRYLNSSSYAWKVLEDNCRLIFYTQLFQNIHAIPLIEKKLGTCFIKSILKDPNVKDIYHCYKRIDALKYLCRNKNTATIFNNKSLFETIKEIWDCVGECPTEQAKLVQECWANLCARKDLLNLVESNLDKLDKQCWVALCLNPHAVKIVTKHVTKLDIECWRAICSKFYCFDLINENIDVLDSECWRLLCQQPKAIKIVEQNFHNLDAAGWKILSKMPHAIHLLTRNITKVNYDSFSGNPMCFEYVGCHSYDLKTTAVMRKRMEKMNAEIIRFVLHPDWISRMAKRYDSTFMDYVTTYYYTQ